MKPDKDGLALLSYLGLRPYVEREAVFALRRNPGFMISVRNSTPTSVILYLAIKSSDTTASFFVMFDVIHEKPCSFSQTRFQQRWYMSTCKFVSADPGPFAESLGRLESTGSNWWLGVWDAEILRHARRI